MRRVNDGSADGAGRKLKQKSARNLNGLGRVWSYFHQYGYFKPARVSFKLETKLVKVHAKMGLGNQGFGQKLGRMQKKVRQREMKNKKEEEIHGAARNGDVNSIELIISDNPLALNSRDKHSRTPLHLAAWAGHANVVSALCKHKADVGAAAMDDMAAIHFAAQKGHLEVVKILVSSGASTKAVNRKGMTVLHYAVQGSHIELTKYLLKKGLNVNAKTKAGKTVLDLASNDEIRSLLVEHEKGKLKESQGGDENVVEQGKDIESGSQLEGEAKEDEHQESSGENLKRKGDVQESLPPKPKKSKVALSHLLSSDDTQEDEAQ